MIYIIICNHGVCCTLRQMVLYNKMRISILRIGLNDLGYLLWWIILKGALIMSIT